jgi:hypothetical protein
MADDAGALGPVSYVIVEYPKGIKVTGEGLRHLLDLSDRGIIRVLDLLFVERGADDTIRILDVRDIDHDGELDLTVFEGARSGLLDAADLAEAQPVLAPGAAAAILVFENRWAAPFVTAVRGGGAELIAAGYIPQEALAASLDALETAAR